MAEELQVRYRRGIGITLVMASIFVLLDAFVVSLKGGFPFSLISGFITLYGGYLFVNKTYLTLSKHELTLYKLTGKLDRTYTLRSLKDLSLDNNQIVYCPKKTATGIPIYPWLCHQEDWQNLLRAIETSSLAPDDNLNQT
ncbi:hypothetical protein NEA10_09415 [Phormidium yuhuli AB48]|uniref:PH domain-containing protein n=1 Tax=Phormidium yuhuli AB48 TaxID=2940671 RepID=A0ABY5AUI9_9CYAN|nr:hypothetical protein [Phormidium yuhuli]USR92909.1 hypothetical protein NEA10_09415 [Phormidium yuhuli AB48]